MDTDSDINTQQWDNSIRDEVNSVYTRELDGISITSLEDYHRLYSSDQGNNDLESSNDSASWSEDDTQTDSSEYQSDTMMMDDDGDYIYNFPHHHLMMVLCKKLIQKTKFLKKYLELEKIKLFLEQIIL